MISNIQSVSFIAAVRRDFDFNKNIVNQLKEYWQETGYAVEYSITFNEKLNIHEIRSEDFINGVPKGNLTKNTRIRLVF